MTVTRKPLPLAAAELAQPGSPEAFGSLRAAASNLAAAALILIRCCNAAEKADEPIAPAIAHLRRLADLYNGAADTLVDAADVANRGPIQ